MERYICIHGHFYQPPRENPWLERIEIQDSAYPYHDWNERITAECYGPNTASRVLDEDNQIVRLINNYSLMSFNFGPTLLGWLEKHAQDVYEAILDADVESQRRFSGHGSALAQAYNHIIMPLANHRDKYTQIYWGIRDFEHRFGRRPEGMWLPETAVDLETLDILAEIGIRFTILSPFQAQRVRSIESRKWQDVSGGKIDSTKPYLVLLPSGKTLALFFYDAAVSRAIAFEGILKNRKSFFNKLLNSVSQNCPGPQLVHSATDGESFGHHQRLGDTALAYALMRVQAHPQLRLTNYGSYLEKYPPTHTVTIFENTSWSCAHGVERWRSDCGCNNGKYPNGNQAWRKPLRKAMDWLRDQLEIAYEQGGGSILKDPWKARNDYIHIILNRSDESIAAFLQAHTKQPIRSGKEHKALKLLELQRHAMLMYTSCGWFFDDISGIETIQNLQFAARAIQLAKEIFDKNLESGFCKRLQLAKSNDPSHGSGRQIYQKLIKPAMFNFERVCAHHAVSIISEKAFQPLRTGCYSIIREDDRCFSSAKNTFASGKARITHMRTRESAFYSFGLLYAGQLDVWCQIGKYPEKNNYDLIIKELSETFSKEGPKGVRPLLPQRLNGTSYTFSALFRDEQRKFIKMLLEPSAGTIASMLQNLYRQNDSILRTVVKTGNRPPKIFQQVAEWAFNYALQRIFEQQHLQADQAKDIIKKTRRLAIQLDETLLEYLLRGRLEQMAEALWKNPSDLLLLQRLEESVRLLAELPFPVDLWKVQKFFHTILKSDWYRAQLKQVENGNAHARQWMKHFVQIVKALAIRMEPKSSV
jgi:alpha-amylase/alpha-mannosidase (GH57 family)